MTIFGVPSGAASTVMYWARNHPEGTAIKSALMTFLLVSRALTVVMLVKSKNASNWSDMTCFCIL